MTEQITGKIPCWLVWGLSVKDGDLHLLSVSLTYEHAKYTREMSKNKDIFIRVYIEKTETNHMYGATSILSAANMLARQDIERIATHRDEHYHLYDLTKQIFKAVETGDDKRYEELKKIFFFDMSHPVKESKVIDWTKDDYN